jgi:hypothetical protein
MKPRMTIKVRNRVTRGLVPRVYPLVRAPCRVDAQHEAAHAEDRRYRAHRTSSRRAAGMSAATSAASPSLVPARLSAACASGLR